MERNTIINYELEHGRQLQRLDPEKYTPYLAHRLRKYSQDLDEANALDKAREAASEAVSLAHQLHAIDSAKYTATLIACIADYGNVLMSSNFYTEACEIRSELVELTRVSAPAAGRENGVLGFQRCGTFFHRLASTRIAYDAYLASNKLTRELHSLSPVQYSIVLAARLEDHYTSLIDSGSWGKAAVVAAESVKATRDLGWPSPGKYAVDVASWRKVHGVILPPRSVSSPQTRTNPAHSIASLDTEKYAVILIRRLIEWGLCLIQSGSCSQGRKIVDEGIEWSHELLGPDRDMWNVHHAVDFFIWAVPCYDRRWARWHRGSFLPISRINEHPDLQLLPLHNLP